MKEIALNNCIITFGYLFNNIQNMLGMYNLQKGIDYYAEVHQSNWNSMIHTYFMPLTMLGMCVWVPAVLNLNYRDAFKLQNYVFVFYFGLYLRISPLIAILFSMYYLPTFTYGGSIYKVLVFRKKRLICGLSIAIVALLIQETFGHYSGGDNPSRIEGVINAILYAPYYSVSHIIY